MLTSNDVQCREVLIRAHDRIEQYGWIQSTMGYPYGPNCITGAIRYSQPDFSYNIALVRHIFTSIEHCKVEDWNDEFCTSKKMCLDKMAELITLLEKELYKDNIEISSRDEILAAV